MEKKQYGLQINGEDNVVSAFGKGMVNGAVFSALGFASLGGILIFIGKMLNKKQV